jgi:hypothetical protein
MLHQKKEGTPVHIRTVASSDARFENHRAQSAADAAAL